MSLDAALDFDCAGPCAMCNQATDDFARAERGACLLVAMGLPRVSVVDAVRWWRAGAVPSLWGAA